MTVEFLKDAASTVFAFERHHKRIDGTIALPVYGAPPPNNPSWPNGKTSRDQVVNPTACRIVRLHAPIEEVIIVWRAEKEGAAPLVPNPYLFDPNLVFREGRRSAAVPMDLPGYRGHAWTMSGEYRYHMTRPTDLNSTMPVGIVPWEDQIPVTDAVIPNVNFIGSLLEQVPDSFQDPIYVAPTRA